MILQCRCPFGHFKPGDTVEVPDGAIFDETYFEGVTGQATDTEPAKGGDE